MIAGHIGKIGIVRKGHTHSHGTQNIFEVVLGLGFELGQKHLDSRRAHCGQAFFKQLG